MVLKELFIAFLIIVAVSAPLAMAKEVSSDHSRPVVKAWIKSGKPVKKRVRTLSELNDFAAEKNHKLDRFGGTHAYQPLPTTGYFRTKKIGKRWWLIDPEGRRFLHVAVNSVKPGTGPTFRKAFPDRFQSTTDWATQTVSLLNSHGFNGTGSWTDDNLLRSASTRLVYTRILNFMSSFGRKLKLTKQGSGHQSYKDRLIPVFHPGFPAHCREVAKRLKATKDDQFLLGIFSDNELEYNEKALDLHLQFPAGSPERQSAQNWLKSYSHHKITAKDLTKEMRHAYVGYMFNTYFEIVSEAIREVDPNHLLLGPRLHGAVKQNQFVLAAAGRHLDVVALNVYGVWTPAKSIANWVRWSGKPVMVTEFYAKGQDSGLANLSGAGWTVPTQHDRGRFYQHFTLSLLQSQGCVGWHYFKYVDNDPLDLTTDPSNRNSNKGILNSRYEPWEDFLLGVKAVNTEVYALAKFFDE